MFPFNRYAKGLLGLLDAKTQGVGPAWFEDAVRGTVDVFPFFNAANARVHTGVQIPVGGTVGFLNVGPRIAEGEIGFLLGIGMNYAANLAAGDRVVMTPCIQRGTSAFNHEAVADAIDMTGTAGGVRPLLNGMAFGPRLMLPGDQAGFWVSQAVLAAGINVNTFAMIQHIAV